MKISLWWKSLSARQKHLLILRAAAAYFLTYALAGQMGNLVTFLGGGLGPQAGPYGTHSGAMLHAVPVVIAVAAGAAIDLAILIRKRKQIK